MVAADIGKGLKYTTDRSGNIVYNNAVAAREFVMAISSVLKDQQWAEVCASPVLSVMVDETTDISTDEELIIYLVYITTSGEVVSKYSGIMCVESTTAHELFNVITSYLVDHGVDLRRVVGLGTDGASNMTGRENGLGAKFKSVCGYIVCIHCICHRLALACADAAVGFHENIEKVVSMTSSYFNMSSKRSHSLKQVCDELSISRTKVVKSGKTRWLSRSQAVNSIVACFTALVVVFTDDTDSLVAGLILNEMLTFSWVAAILFLSDVLQLLHDLSLLMQTQCVDYEEVEAELEVTKRVVLDTYLATADGAAIDLSTLDADGVRNASHRG